MNRKLQDEIGIWRRKNFPKTTPEQQFIGVTEEVGELAHAILKFQQGIRGFDNDEAFNNAAQDAIADICIYLANFCDMLGWDMEKIIEAVWEERVKDREWNEKQAKLPMPEMKE